MVTRQQRLDDFRQDEPPLGEPLELLCEDHCGTYELPYACHWSNGSWRNAATGATISVLVVGWRSLTA